MTLRLIVSISGFFVALGLACKTVSRGVPESQERLTAEPVPADDEAPPVPPSPALKGTTDLVTPGPDEVLIRRGPNARCPTGVELDMIERTVTTLGKDTIDLVKEDLDALRQTITRKDQDAINSCCNQLEQLVQDAEIMNEDKDSATAALDKIRKTTRQLCPAG